MLREDIVSVAGKQYFRRYTPKNTQYDRAISAAIHNYRQEEEERAKLPLDIWEK